MRRDLKHAVGGRVADRLSGLQVQLAELFDDFGSRGVAVAEYAGDARFFHKPLDKLRREAGLCPREITPVEADRDPGDFPMSGRRILAFGLFAGAAEMQAGAAAMLQSCGLASGCKITRCAKAEFDQIGNVQRSFARIVVRVAGSAGVGDVADGVCTLVAICGCVGSSADTYRIHHDDHGTHVTRPFVDPASAALVEVAAGTWQ